MGERINTDYSDVFAPSETEDDDFVCAKFDDEVAKITALVSFLTCVTLYIFRRYHKSIIRVESSESV